MTEKSPENNHTDEEVEDSIDNLIDDESYIVPRRHNLYSLQTRTNSKSISDTPEFLHAATDHDGKFRDKSATVDNDATRLMESLKQIGAEFSRQKTTVTESRRKNSSEELGSQARTVKKEKASKKFNSFAGDIPASKQGSVKSSLVSRASIVRKGSHIRGSLGDIREETSGLLELGSKLGAKVKGKILINSYMEMDSLKSDNVSHYSTILKETIAGKVLPQKGNINEEDEEEEVVAKNEGNSSEDSQLEHHFNSEESEPENKMEGPDEDTLGMLENYVDVDHEEEKSDNNLPNGLQPIEYDEDPERALDEFAPPNMFRKFNDKQSVQKRAIKPVATTPIVRSLPANGPSDKEVGITQIDFPTQPKEKSAEKVPLVKGTSVNQTNHKVTQEQQAFKNPELVHTMSDKKQKEEQSPPRHDSLELLANELFSNEQTKNITNDKVPNSATSSFIGSQDENSTQKHSSSLIVETIPSESAVRDNKRSDSVSSATLESFKEPEESEKKNTIRVLSKFDSEMSAGSSLTLQKVIAKNTGKERDRAISTKNKVVQQVTQPEEQLKISKQKTLNKIPVPEDPLDTFDAQDQYNLAIDPTVDFSNSMVVTQNNLIGSYKLKITDTTPCNTLTHTFCDAANNKKAYEPSIIKFSPPDFIFVGTTASTVLVYDCQEKLKQTIKYNEGPKQTVTAIDCSLEDPELHVLVVGFSGGHIALYDLKTFALIKSITDVHTSKVSSLRVYQSHNPIKFFSCDEAGEIFSFQVQKVLWFFKEEHHLVLKDSDTFSIDVEILPKEVRVINSSTLLEQEYLKNVLIIAKIDCVVLMNLNQSNDNNYSHLLEWVFERPADVPLECLPSISVGKGALVENKRKTYILISWGKILHLVSFSYNGLKILLSEVGYFELTNNVQFSSWMADDIIVVIDDKNIVYFINVEEFTEGKYGEQKAEGEEKELPKESGKEKSFMYKFTLDKGLRATIVYINNKKNIWKPHKHAISVSNNQHQMLLLCEDQFMKVKIVSALEYLDLLVAGNEWLKFLTMGVQIFHLAIKELHGIPQDKEFRRKVFLPFFQEKITAYLNENLQLGKNSEQYHKEVILSLVDFLVELEDTEFLFGFVYRKSCEVGLQKTFIDLLEPFITLDKIKYVPDEQLKAIINHYCRQKKSNLMQKLIFNLDLAKQECFLLIHLCLEHNLYSALINVCTNTEENFITPFVKQINDYRSAKQHKNEEEAQKYGYRCLWYLRLCIEKKTIPDLSEESLEKWKKIMNQLMVMVFEPENLKILFETDGDLTTCFVMLFFIGDLAGLIEESYGNLVVGNVKPGDTTNDNVHFQIYAIVKQVLNSWPGPEKKTLFIQYFGFFLGILAHLLRYSFLDRDLCVEFADMYISQPTLLSEKLLLLWEKIRLRKEGKTSEEIKEYFKEKIDYDFIFEQRVGVILDLLKYCQFTLTKEQISDLAKKAKASNLIEIECFLLSISWEYKACFNLYTSRATADSKVRVFDWVVEAMKQFLEKSEKTEVEKKAIDELKFAIIEKLQTLLSMDIDKTISIIDTYLNDKILYVLNMEFRADLKLKILEKHMRKHEESTTYDEKLLIMYIKLLAQSDKKQRRKIKSIIQSSNRYPLNTCLEICKKYSVKDVWAYLEVKQGKIENAINISYEHLEDTLREAFVVGNSEEKEEIAPTLDNLEEYLNQNTTNSEIVWFEIIIKIFKFYESNKEKISSESVKQEFTALKNHILDRMMEDILKSFETKALMKTIESLYEKFPPILRQHIITRIISHNLHEQFVLSYCKRLLCTDILDFIQVNLIPLQIRGSYNLPNCEGCHRNFRTYEYILWFGCGHIYHSSETCCPGGFCTVCQTSSSTLILNTVYYKISRQPKTLGQASKNVSKPAIEDDFADYSRSRAVTRSFKDNQDQYYSEKAQKLNKYWNKKTASQSELNAFTEKYL